MPRPPPPAGAQSDSHPPPPPPPTPSSSSSVSTIQTPAVATALPSATCCSATADEVIVHLSTTITIPDYHRYYDSPIESFTPTYETLPDGSLVTQPYLHNLKNTYSSLIFLSVLTAVFFRNILVSGDYIRRGKVKKKSLFYLLFASQLLGPVVLLPFLISYTHDSVNCTLVFTLSCAVSFVSICILITGILGVKAYMCLDRSRIVGAVLIFIQMVWLAIAVVDGFEIQGERQLSGQCNRTSNGMIPYMVVAQCVQSFFISCCFIYAVWKSSGLPAARSRISLLLSSMDHMDEKLSNLPDASTNNDGDGLHMGRGWWDYVPGSEKPPLPNQGVSSPRNSGLFFALRRTIGRLWRSHEDDDLKIAAARKPSLHSEFPLRQSSSIRLSESPALASGRGETARARSPVPSFSSHIIGLRPRMVLLREVMRDELCYTTFITSLCVVVTVVAVAGVNTRMLNVAGWMTLNWTVISVLAVHSFGRVIHRHEIEAMMEHPWSWDHSFQGDRRALEPAHRRRSSSLWSPKISITSRRARCNGHFDRDDISEGNIRLYPRSKGDESISISHSSLPSPEPSLCGSTLSVPLHHAPGITSSPTTEEFHISYPGFDSSNPRPQQTVFTPADLPLHHQQDDR